MGCDKHHPSCKDVPPVMPVPVRYVPPFWGFTEFSPTIPKLYWNVRSQEQRILRICDLLDKLICYADMLGDKVSVNKEDIEELKELFEKFMESGFVDYYEKQIYGWIEKNMAELISRSIKQVYFGLNAEGYFVAYVPESWSDITFDTGAVYGRSDYGRLKLRFEADGAIDNRYTYNVSQLTSDDQFVNDFEALNNAVAQWGAEIESLDERVDALEG